MARNKNNIFGLMRALLLLAFLIAATPVLANSRCVTLNGPKDYPVSPEGMIELGTGKSFPAAEGQKLKGVAERIASVSGVRPVVSLCDLDQPNAVALEYHGLGLAVFDYRLVQTMDEDMLAYVVGHEFAHLQMRHSFRRKLLGEELLRGLYREAAGLERAGRLSEASLQAAAERQVGAHQQSRRGLEDEADNIGFKFMVDAGYNPEAAARAGREMTKIMGHLLTGYFDGHPGWLERIERLGLFSENEQYRRVADGFYRSGDPKRLTEWVSAWLERMPKSGTAWLYKGFVLRMQGAGRRQTGEAFERAVTYDMHDANAWTALCVELYREGYKAESARCSRNIKYPHLVREFDRQTFNGRLYVDLNVRSDESNLHFARTRSGGKLITNDPGLIAAGELRAAPVGPEWKPIRE